MRVAYALLGVVWCIVIVVVLWSVNHTFTKGEHSKTDTRTTVPTSMAMQLSITSPVFQVEGVIPQRYTCDGEAVSPPLTISGVSEAVKTLVLIVEDRDVPKALKPDGIYDHWILFNIPAMTTDIAEGASAGISGKNSAGENGYAAPCPPKEYEPSEHRYFFRLYALDTELLLSDGASRQDVEAAMAGHVLQEALVIGRYARK
ncbi:MAG TPA: YbhB/YbcL family Raf kinase inhibitor-like protein [Candidatus Paceibacterota bacterium]|jgi:Raf kinase inhibitor-like YbhB/YbcL family protein|nr:YbhB/YbcL family Raf kinase inhibitor-like protein [Candidatus Paceibacterota bacterium]